MPTSKEQFIHFQRQYTLWRALPIPLRDAILEMEPGFAPVSPVLLRLPADLDARLFDTRAGNRKKPSAEFLPFLKYLRQLLRWSEGPDFGGRCSLRAYFGFNLQGDQRRAFLTASYVAQGGLDQDFEGALRSGEFLKRLLNSGTPTDFLADMGGYAPVEGAPSETEFRLMKEWCANAAKMAGEVWPFALTPKDDVRSAPEAEETGGLLYWLVTYGLACDFFDAENLVPVVGVLRPSRESPPAPPWPPAAPAFVPVESGSHPVLLDDMEVLLRAMETQPAPLLSDGISAPVAYFRKMTKSFVAWPIAPSVEAFLPEHRARDAFFLATALGLVFTETLKRKAQQVKPSATAQAWLAKPREQRWKDVIDALPWKAGKGFDPRAAFLFLGDFPLHPFPYNALSGSLMPAIPAFLSELEHAVEWKEAMTYASEHRNPFIADLAKDYALRGLWSRWELGPEEVYARLFAHAVRQWASVGALAFHRDAEGELGISLTDAGRTLCGQTPSFAPPAAPTARPVALLTGDYTLTLLESAPDLSVLASSFAEPLSDTTFRITKASVQAALYRGQTVEGIGKALAPWLKRDIPRNVKTEMAGWARSKTQVRMAPALLIEGDDPVVMAELLTAYPKVFTRVSDTALKADANTPLAPLLKKLEKRGIFVAGGS